MRKIRSISWVLFALAPALLLFITNVAAQEQGRAQTSRETTHDSLNQKDKQNRKQGTWFFQVAPLRGEPGYTRFGNYRDDQKQGAWYTLDTEGRLMSIEHFRRDILDGQAQYYEKGKLVCDGQYRAFSAQQKIDSIWITDPITLYDTLVAITNYQGPLKHGVWRYYDATSGQLVKEEIYQVDDLVSEKTFQYTSVTDSMRIEQRKQALPHNKKGHYRPPAGKGRVLQD